MISPADHSSNDWDKLVTAAEQGQIYISTVLLIFTKDPDLIYTTNAAGENSLYELARIGNVYSISEMMRFLGRRLVREMLLEKNTNGNTPLHLALKNKHQEAACLLLKEHRNAAFVQNDDGISSRDLAVSAGYSKVLDIIPCFGTYTEIHSSFADMEMSLAYRRDLFCVEERSRVDSFFRIPRHVRHEFSQAINGGDMNQIELELDRFGGNFFHIAARLGRVDLLELLVKARFFEARPLERDLNGDTPLHLALQGQHEIAALYLIQMAPVASYMLNYMDVSPLLLFL